MNISFKSITNSPAMPTQAPSCVQGTLALITGIIAFLKGILGILKSLLAFLTWFAGSKYEGSVIWEFFFSKFGSVCCKWINCTGAVRLFATTYNTKIT